MKFDFIRFALPFMVATGACNRPPAPRDDLPRSSFTRGAETAKRFGVHEIILSASRLPDNPFAAPYWVDFTAPSGLVVPVRAFYDGGNTWRARAYISESGRWKWKVRAPGLERQEGSFAAVASQLRGMLRKHEKNPRQWMTDDGTWFLNLSETAPFLLRDSEKLWKEFVRDSWAHGITLMHVGALGGEDWDPEPTWTAAAWHKLRGRPDDLFSNCPWDGKDQSRFDLARFQTTDYRLRWLLESYPGLYFQMVLIGRKAWKTDDTGLAWEALPRDVRERTLDYLIARWAAFPTLIWEVANDMQSDDRFPHNQAFVRDAGSYVAGHDPWKHLLSTGLERGATFPFVTARDSWASYIHLEGEYELGADLIRKYDGLPLHVFLAEDRFEHDRRTRDPKNPDYFYRWLFWSWLVSGGSANYGGRWREIQPYSQTGGWVYHTAWAGDDGYTTQAPLRGLDSIPHIKEYFEGRGIDLSGYTPAQAEVADANGKPFSLGPRLCRRGGEDYLVYHPNALCNGKDAAPDPDSRAALTIDLRRTSGKLEVEWYRPSDGAVQRQEPVEGGALRHLEAPWLGCDVVVRLLSGHESADTRRD